jgi:2-oxoisovalerate dehydrogenase E1 component
MAGSRPASHDRPGLKYFACDGLDIYDTYRVPRRPQITCANRKRPAFLHIRTIRLYGHAGADVATTYLPLAEVEPRRPTTRCCIRCAC